MRETASREFFGEHIGGEKLLKSQMGVDTRSNDTRVELRAVFQTNANSA